MATLIGPLPRLAASAGTTLAAKTSADTTYGAAIGNMYVLAFVCNSSSATASVADSAGNTWVQEDVASGGSSNRLFVFTCRVTIAVPTNGTITITSTSTSRRVCQLYKIQSPGGFLARNKLVHAVGTTTSLSLGSFGSLGDADEYVFKFDGMSPAGVASGRADATSGWTDKGTVDSGGVTIAVGVGSSFIAAATRGGAQFANTATQSTAAQRASIMLSIRGISAPADTYVQSFSPTGSATNTVTATPLFAPTTGNTLFAVVAANENTGADDINTPSFWTLMHTVRNVAGTHVRAKMFGITVADWIANGSPAMTFTSTAAQRLQASVAEFSGEYNLTAEVTATDEATSGTTETPGSVTPLGTGRLVIMACIEKQTQPLDQSAGTYASFTVWNEDPSVTSSQKLCLWVGYIDNRGTSATTASVTGQSVPWAGFSISLAPAAPPAILPASTGVSFGASSSITAPTSITPATSGVAFGGTGSIATPKAITPATAGVSFAGSASIAAPTSVAPAATGVSFGGTGAITSIPRVSATGSVSFDGTSSISAPTGITPAASGVSFAGTGALTAPTRIVFAVAGVSFGSSGSITAPSSVTPAAAGVSFAGTGSITAPTRVAPAASGVSFAGSASITAPTGVAPATSGVTFSGSAALTAPTRLVVSSTGVSFSGTGALTAPTRVAPAAAGVSFSGTGTVTAGSTPFISGTGGAAFSGTGALTAPTRVTFAAGGVSFAGSGTVSAPTRVAFASSGVAFAATGSLTAPTRISSAGSGVAFAATASLTAAALISSTSSVVFSGAGSISANATTGEPGFAVPDTLLLQVAVPRVVVLHGARPRSFLLDGADPEDV